ncbi:MAG TPA: HWE histidine kinase domain-containing protein [Xanthobacteraceae bacterium]|nr:HWE histidine kinase domain-containing protein [Xanthobacteraceae bacterium]
MNSPDQKKPPMAEPDAQTADNTATEFFPNFATIRSVLEAAQIGIWSWDIATNKVTWSSNLEAIHRRPSGSFDGTYTSFERDIRRDDLSKVEDSIKEALRGHGTYRARYRLAQRDGAEDCWLESSGTVAVKDGVPERLLGLCHDITERVNLEAELRSRAKQQEALAQLGERALVEPDLERLLKDAVSTVAVTLSVDFVKILELLPGNTDLLLRAGFGWKQDLIGSIVASTEPNTYARFTLDSPSPLIIDDFSGESRFKPEAYLRQHGCSSGVNVTIAGRDDRFYGILGVCTKGRRRFGAQDATFLVAVANLLAGAIARRQLEQRHELMIRDMRHRSGNLFSQLLALFSQTAKNSKSIADLAAKYRARVLALANAQRLITEGGGQSIPIMDLLNVLLGPYLDRISFTGPNVELEPDPVFNLSAALHELADNAVKHGSLSRPKGHLDLNWSVSRTERGMTLALDWVEKNGPPTRRPRKLGFGSRLIGLVIERQLNGDITRTFKRTGLSVHMIVPLTHERWPIASTAGSPEDATQPSS